MTLPQIGHFGDFKVVFEDTILCPFLHQKTRAFFFMVFLFTIFNLPPYEKKQ